MSLIDSLLSQIKQNPAQAVAIVKPALPALRLFAPALVVALPDSTPLLRYVKADPDGAFDVLSDLVELLEKHPALVQALAENYGH